jgi:hypothetical protein
MGRSRCSWPAIPARGLGPHVLCPGVVLSQQHIPDDLVVKTAGTHVMTERRRDATPTGTKGCSVPPAGGCATADREVGR